MFCCLRTCFNENMRRTASSAASRMREPDIFLDSSFAGNHFSMNLKFQTYYIDFCAEISVSTHKFQ